MVLGGTGKRLGRGVCCRRVTVSRKGKDAKGRLGSNRGKEIDVKVRNDEAPN